MKEQTSLQTIGFNWSKFTFRKFKSLNDFIDPLVSATEAIEEAEKNEPKPHQQILRFLGGNYSCERLIPVNCQIIFLRFFL